VTATDAARALHAAEHAVALDLDRIAATKEGILLARIFERAARTTLEAKTRTFEEVVLARQRLVTARYLAPDLRLDDDARRLDELAKDPKLRFAAWPWATHPQANAIASVMNETLTPNLETTLPRSPDREWPAWDRTLLPLEFIGESWIKTSFLEDLLLRNPRVVVYWFTLGRFHGSNGDLGARALAVACALAPDNPEAHFYRTQALRSLGRHEDALESIKRARMIEGSAQWYAFRHAEVLAGLGRDKEAFDVIASMTAFTTEEGEVTRTKRYWLMRAALARSIGDETSALEADRKARSK
jgi:tetratricopeptide (TPR) repeat protein